MFARQPLQPHSLLGSAPQRRLRRLRQREIVPRVPRPGRVALATLLEMHQRELAHGLQEGEARFAAPIRHHEAVIDEHPHHVEHRRRPRIGERAHRLGRGECAAAREDGEPPEHRPRCVREEVVAPCERRAQGAVPFRQIVGSVGEEGKPQFEARQQIHGQENCGPRGGQFDGQGQPVQSTADGGDRDRLGPVQREVRYGSPGARDEQGRRGIGGERFFVGDGGEVRDGEGRHGIAMLAAQA